MATDVISSSVQYERAAERVSSAADATANLEQAARRAALANEKCKPLDPSMLPEVEARLEAAFCEAGGFDEAVGVLQVQDDLYRKFKIRYGADSRVKFALDDQLTAERVLLHDAIVSGDLDAVRALMTIDWNFVYPPAFIDENGDRQLEGWCRTPLCLVVRPDEGNFGSKLCNVSSSDRQLLLQDVLASGCADPNFPPVYWSNPAVHACFEGDLEALEALRVNGCNLRSKYEWALQSQPLFSLVHAAAFNGQEKVLRYLRQHFPPSFFREVDAAGNSALHTLLESSRDMPTAHFLLEQGVDGFAFNSEQRSPLSMSIEYLPELALLLLQQKSSFEYRWWGNDLYWFSFNGVVLPLDGSGRPVQARDACGDITTIEKLIIRYKRKNLLETPIMLDMLDNKFKYFAAEAFVSRIAKFVSMLLAVDSKYLI